MIDVKELRIGNLVFDKLSNRTMSVAGVSFTDSKGFVFVEAVEFENSEYNYKGVSFQPYLSIHFEPIQLTAEILEQCGFEKSKSHHLDFFKDTGIGNNFFTFRLGRPFKHESQWWQEIKYLHQLQNLYFAITGKELTVNHTALSPLH